MTKHYIDGPFGQIHIRRWGDDSCNEPLLICLAPSPFSGVAYSTLAPLLASERRVVAIDYPGYGLSDPCDKAPLIEDYAKAVAAVIEALSADEPVDLLGFHTGCLVAVETSLLFTERVKRMLLVDVPFFEPAKQEELLAKTPLESELSSELLGLNKAWDFCVAKRLEHIPLPRAYDMFLDYISAGQASNAAFRAAFQYSCEAQFSKVSTPCWVIATSSGLFEPSRATAEVIQNAELVELTEITVAVLEKGAPIISQAVSGLLSN